jgi:hypothetical protein
VQRFVETFQDLSDTFLTLGGEILDGLIAGLTGDLGGVLDAVGNIGGTIVDKFKEFFGISSPSRLMAGFGSDVIDGLAGGITDVGPVAVGAMGGVITSIAQGAGALPGQVIGAVGDMGPQFYNWATGAFGQAKTAFSTGSAALVSQVGGLPQSVINQVTALIAMLDGWAIKTWQQVKVAFTAALAALVSMTGGLPGGVLGSVAQLGNQLAAWAGGIWGRVQLIFTRGINGLVSLMTRLPGQILGSVASLVNMMVAWASNMWSRVQVLFTQSVIGLVSLMTRLPSQILSAVNPLSTGLVTWASTMLDRVRAAFVAGVTAIGIAWARIQDVARIPVKFVVDKIINQGILRGFNAVAKPFGIDRIDNVVVPFARGGIPSAADLSVWPGYTPGRDTGLIAVGGGEAIMRPEWTRAVGPEHVHAVNKAARSGGVAGVRRFLGGMATGGIVPGLGLPFMGGFDGGGIVGWIGGKIRDAASFIIGNLMQFAEPLVGKLRGLLKVMPGNKGSFKEAIRNAPKTLLTGFLKFVRDKEQAALESGGAAHPDLFAPGGVSVGAILAVARRFFSGARVSSGLRNSNDYHGRGLAADLIGGGNAGMKAMAAGFYSMSGSLLELIHSQSPGFFVKHGRRVGANYYRSVIGDHYDHVHVAASRKALGYDKGGFLPTGTSLVRNSSGGPEPVFTRTQFADLSALVVALTKPQPLLPFGALPAARPLVGAGATVPSGEATATGGGQMVNVYPRAGQSEQEIGLVAARQLEWMRGRW